MQIKAQMTIRSNPYLYQYLRENSYWYKMLNRDPSAVFALEEEMKEKYKMTAADKIENIAHTVSLLKTFLEVMR